MTPMAAMCDQPLFSECATYFAKCMKYTQRYLLMIYFSNKLWVHFSNLQTHLFSNHVSSTDYDYHITSTSSYLAKTICKVIFIESGKRVDSIPYKTPPSAFSSPCIVSFQCSCSRVLDTYNICIVCPNTFEERLKIQLVFYSLPSP